MQFTERRTTEDSYENVLVEAIVDDEVVGEMSLMVSDDEAYIERIDVAEEYRGRGYGTQMIQHVSQNYGLVYAAADNEDAKRLYDRLGCEMTDAEYDRVGVYVDQGFGVHVL